MAVKWLVKSGNDVGAGVGANSWNDPTMWNGGTVPQPGDDVYANGFSIYISTNITVNSLNNSANATYGIVDAGVFYLYYTPCTITANVYSGNGQMCIYCYGNFTHNLIGNVEAGNAYCVYMESPSQLNIVGTVYGSLTNLSTGVYLTGSGLGILNVTGNVYGRAGVGINNATGSIFKINVTGNVFCVGVNYGIAHASNSQYSLKIYGIIKGSTSNTVSAVYALFAYSCLVQAIDFRGASPALGIIGFLPSGQFVTGLKEDGSQITLTNPDEPGVFPSEIDVRAGIIFANGDKTGTCEVPPKEAVGFGVPVDDTEGEAIFTAEALLNEIANSSNLVAERLRNCSTVQTTSAQLNA